jgi:predicted CXXCH cytochrome family protein
VPGGSHGLVALRRLTGSASLGTDLSDDHPISFVYDTALAIRDGQLADPATLPKSLPLDETQQLQCTTCHDAHENPYRKFLRMDDRAGALCAACHTIRHWAGSAHATSPATWQGARKAPWPESAHTTVAGDACEACHQPHAAPRPPRLLSNAQERGVCLGCHTGKVATRNLEPEFLKGSVHPIAATDWVHDPREDPLTMLRHVTCVDCHNPHQTVAAPASPPIAPGALRGVRGVNISGATVKAVNYEYGVCLKCHGMRDETAPDLVRQDNTRNVRVEISPSNPSFHPIAATGKNTTMGGFETGYTPASFIYCTDCHNNDESPRSRSAPRGPHGSRFRPILEREYDTDDPSPESFQTYALCYKCHNRSFLLTESAGPFPHRKHVVEQEAPCAVCHDAHGSRKNTALINFMLRDRTGKTVVKRSQTERRLEYVSRGRGRGECYLECHGANHEPTAYP